ncbi:hypothetical protein Ava_B0275 (plasmid) [Trichormus variabilis ATCC 29413]|uniref:Uncharacterized protein n=2 Tax=Anabaena variabilis TaxID=264691 RepID=Q3M200_TRIV2|nr:MULTISPECIES: hypothetical protein [Nostocaceae]ABA24986.1 hypothetical protein Ava_B0275 [Trichormus variabilis ATCC 29413]MBC1217790.1 hypothetical protein [Trichormus variabilis ARAD]MBC1259070.1 hypothetical protein [Trichormus variabilis V5]MBC1270729.1 hypothetical protein [Trichormus variabilis FSR]MBC1305578.1 hypothetical protein [Trichormus variabilis N2B]
MQVTITIPRGWGYPRFTFGQRTKQGTVVGIEYISSDSLIGKEGNAGWQYGLLPDKNSKDIVYLKEEEIQPFSAKESEEKNLNEIDAYLNEVAILQAQLGVNLDIQTLFGDVKPTTSKPMRRQSISRKSAA